MSGSIHHFHCFFFFGLIILFQGCKVKLDETVSKNMDTSMVLPHVKKADSIFQDSVSVLIVPCSNGYEYVMHNYDFDPVLEKALRLTRAFVVVPFPYKMMMGVNYYGVYDKKYCQPILDKIDVDYLIMTRFTGNAFPEKPLGTEIKWGYEVKILNVHTGEQRISITANDLDSYREIEKHIVDNVFTLKDDLANLD